MHSDSASLVSEATLVQQASDLSSINVQSTFHCALDDYLGKLTEKQQKRNFILRSVQLGPLATPEVINQELKRLEETKSSKNAITGVFFRIADALKEYSGIVDTLVSSAPTPVAIVWGALKLVIDGAKRHSDLFDTIKSELRKLSIFIIRINMFNELYGDSERLQKLFYDAYINMLRFWNRVNRECERSFWGATIQSMTSCSTKKLNDIIGELQANVEDIEKTAPLVEAGLAKGERDEARCERKEAAIERAKAEIERRDARDFRDQYQTDRRSGYYRQVSWWLRAEQLSDSNARRHENNCIHRSPGTCEWLLEHHYYGAWVDGSLQPPTMWVRAPPGYGKTFLCSFAIASIQATHPDAAVAHHFYQFDQHRSAIEVLRLLSMQLFETYWKEAGRIDEEIQSLVEQDSCVLNNVKSLLKFLVQKLSRIFIFVDGLDEERGDNAWQELCKVIDWLTELVNHHPCKIRVWYSSQPRASIANKLASASHIVNITGHGTQDVALFLTRAIQEMRQRDAADSDSEMGKLDGAESDLEEMGKQDGVESDLLDKLVNRADGNFLWASFMAKSLSEDATNLCGMNDLVDNGFPTELDGYYERIFEQIKQPQRALTCKVFSLLVFSRRRLRIGEIREAIGLLQSSSPAAPSAEDRPIRSRLVKIFPPLIEIDENHSDANDSICYIVHSSVRDFLLRHSDILGSDHCISSSIIANACILYLGQVRYSGLLRQQNSRWLDVAGQPVDKHQFILYAAKYWDRHIDELDPTNKMANMVNNFLLSPNFQTCIQVQCLWIDGKFNVFNVQGLPRSWKFLMRILPSWFVRGSAEARKKWMGYRQFIHQWRSFLSCALCGSSGCEVLAAHGEIDRCWWSALGPQNFLSTMPERYMSFSVASNSTSHKGQSFEGVNSEGNRLRVFQQRSRKVGINGTLIMDCEHWALEAGSNPRLLKQQEIRVKDMPHIWQLYCTRQSTSDLRNLYGRASLIALSEDGQYLRVGAQIFILNGDYEYHPLSSNPTIRPDSYPVYVEEFAVRGTFVALASRREPNLDAIYQSGLGDNIVGNFGVHFMRLEWRAAQVMRHPDMIVTGSDIENTTEAETSTSSSNEAYETWSENSTILSEDFAFEEDIILPAGRPSDIDDTDVDSDGDQTDRDMSEIDQESKQGSDSSSDCSWSPNIDQDDNADADDEGGEDESNSEEDDEDEDEKPWEVTSDSDVEPGIIGLGDSRRPGGPRKRATISIFDTQASSDPGLPRRIFHLSLPFHFMLYDSPPVIHPSDPLVVWPLGGGEILFADFYQKTYFTRRVRPSTIFTKHIFMKCHFSSDGRHLHIAALECQKDPEPRGHRSSEEEGKPLKLALLVTTYRLSARKRTHSPPSLIHRVRVDLGNAMFLTVSSLPFTLTWRSDQLYFTVRKTTLRVYRICLFPDGNSIDGDMFWAARNAVLVPKKTVFLPDTATERAVHFFPAPAGSTKARIVIGGGNSPPIIHSQHGDITNKRVIIEKHRHVFGFSGRPAPPVGCYVDEQQDMGGWVKSRDRTEIRDGIGIGKLDRRREKFDYDDDCVLEPYIF